tara:strand:- start:233 stop:745 length:513 start_codon:yes stop_codon:yes gene_type:complete
MKKKIKEEIQIKNSSLKNEMELDGQRIAFSANLISFLEEKKRSFNKKNKSNIKIEQLKGVYVRGASLANEDFNLHGLARVNMFLRMKEQKKMNITSSKASPSKKASELVFEDQETQKVTDLIDISDSWTPEEGDLEEAKANIKEFNLNFNFKNIDELYLEPYRPIQFRWE